MSATILGLILWTLTEAVCEPGYISLSLSLHVSISLPSQLAKLELGAVPKPSTVGVGATWECYSCSVPHERQRSQTLRKIWGPPTFCLFHLPRPLPGSTVCLPDGSDHFCLQMDDLR